GEVADAVPVRVAAVGRAHGDHRVGVAGVGDADSLVASPGRLHHAGEAGVPGCGDHDHARAGAPGALDAPRRPATRVGGDVVRHRQADVGARDHQAAGLLVDVADRPQGGDDRELLTIPIA